MDGAPDLALIAELIGDRTRAAMLTSLMGGRALTAGELASAARVTKQTASSHLARLADARLVMVDRRGRHRYVRLAGRGVARALEQLMRLARSSGATTARTGPADPALRKARVCYDHLAGELGVFMLDALRARGDVRTADARLALTARGEAFCTSLGIDVAALRRGRRPLCLECLDWSERRPHLAGAVGAALLDRCIAMGWARRPREGRAILFSAPGELALRRRLRISR